MKKLEREIKKDLLTGEEIPYKSKEFFYSNLYCNRTNLIKHFKTISVEKAEEITKELLLKRIDIKNIKYSLSTVEAHSLIFPSVVLLDKIGINYSKICKECGLKDRYKYKFNLPKDFKFIKKIFIDSREQKPLDFNTKTETVTLSFGDYAANSELDNCLSIERKNASDFIGTMSKGFERFCREIIRAEKNDSKILIVVDQKITDLLNFNYLPQFKWIKATPTFIFSRLRELLQAFPNIQIVFVNGREEASKLTHFALSYGPPFLKFDIQFLYNTQQLNKYIK